MTHNLHKERCTYAIISAFFALSYIGRFIYNKYFNGCDEVNSTQFESAIMEELCYLLEGASMGVLMYFHFANFREGGLFSTTKEEELAFITIMPNEYHRFDTESVEAHSLADLSSDNMRDSEKDGKEQASLGDDADKQLIPSRHILNPSTISNPDGSVSRDQNE